MLIIIINGITGFLPNIILEAATEVFRVGGCSWRFTGFTGGRLCRGLFFSKFAGLMPAALLKERLWRGYFFYGFCKNSERAFSTEDLRKTGSVFYSHVLKIDLAILISYWLLVSCVFWRYISSRGRTASGLMGVLYFVFIILAVDETGKILIKVSHKVESN